MQIRSADNATKAQIDLAIGHLKAARDALAKADCPRALNKVRSAVSSAQGAKRHAGRRPMRDQS